MMLQQLYVSCSNTYSLTQLKDSWKLSLNTQIEWQRERESEKWHLNEWCECFTFDKQSSFEDITASKIKLRSLISEIVSKLSAKYNGNNVCVCVVSMIAKPCSMCVCFVSVICGLGMFVGFDRDCTHAILLVIIAASNITALNANTMFQKVERMRYHSLTCSHFIQRLIHFYVTIDEFPVLFRICFSPSLCIVSMALIAFVFCFV